jgi:hypothetical protein
VLGQGRGHAREEEQEQLRARVAEEEPPVGLMEWFENCDPSLE